MQMVFLSELQKQNLEKVLGPLLPSSQAGLDVMPSGGTENTPKEVRLLEL